MLPATSGFLRRDFQIVHQPGKTYGMGLDTHRVQGRATGWDDMVQRVYKILNTERYQYVIYSWNFGLETRDLYGKPVSFAVPEFQRRITEALLWDPRISGVDNFQFDTGRGWVHATFQVRTTYGDFLAERRVEIYGLLT